MPAEDYDARALALPLDNESPVRGNNPGWSRRSASFRRSNSFQRPSPTLRERVEKLQRQVVGQYNKLSKVQRILFATGGVTIFVLSILFLVYNERIFHSMLPYAKKWRDITAGWMILWALIFTVSFPPLIGYSSLLTVAGFVYGFPNGWFIAASATIVGSTVSFILSRSILKNMVERLIANDKRFAALALTLKHDGLKLLIMIRMCPLPYSLSNGAIATFPTVHWTSFAAATAIVSPKLMLHIFIGSQIEKIAESGGKMPPKAKALSYVSIAIGGIAGAATAWFMYKKTKERGRQLEAEERAGARRTSVEDLENEYADDPDALEAAEALREDEDDISLRDSGWGDEYHDEPADAEDILEIDDDPFTAGDGDEEEEVGGRR
ncbi:hypothetical protein K504DRAFT_458273 [Pleomassaria siparia CBS 279.74]|uniref:Golgi apparatus membrane protein TVP38 n=1 Tax=Pleomassaria siparia CBS 279.74 TaxID=1314801 RepID=A0A6G1K4V8_9PLEO|nr:hypothetical protein K504DRAFT_458273 [Pleomassaria siparia CBS 279.74]